MKRAASFVFFCLMALPTQSGEPEFSRANLHVRSSFGRLLEKGQRGQSLRIAFLGGSITQNPKGHTGMVPSLLKQRLPKARIETINAGLASTCSTSGAFRLDSQVLARGPLDLLVVEFAVNDDQDAGHPYARCVRGMEGIVRQMKRRSPDTELVIVYFLNEGMMAELQKGKTPVPIRAHEAVARHYGVTSVNVAAEVAEEIRKGRYTWKDYGGVHPKSFGYGIAARMIVAAITGGWERSDLPATSDQLPEPIDPFSYASGRFIAPDRAKTRGGWKLGTVSRALLPAGSIRSQYQEYPLLRGDRPGDSLSLSFTGSAVGAFILAGPDAGRVRARVDGGPWREHELFHRFSVRLNYPRSVIFADELPKGNHRLDLEILDQSDARSSGHALNVLYFEVN